MARQKRAIKSIAPSVYTKGGYCPGPVTTYVKKPFYRTMNGRVLYLHISCRSLLRLMYPRRIRLRISTKGE